MHPTFTWVARDVPLGMSVDPWGALVPSTKALLFNGSKNTIMEILRADLVVVSAGVAAVTNETPSYGVAKVSSVSGGAVVSPIPFDSSDPLPSQVVCRLWPDAVGGDVFRRLNVSVAGYPQSAVSTLPVKVLTHIALANRLSAISAPITLNEGEGIAIVPDALGGRGGAGPLVIDCTVADAATGTLSIFRGEYIAVGAGPAMCVFNGAGSGVTLVVTDIAVSCAAFTSSGTPASLCSWYAADKTPTDEPASIDDTASIICHDTQSVLPSGVSAWRGEMMTMTSARPWLEATVAAGLLIPQSVASSTTEPAPYIGATARTIVTRRRNVSDLMPSCVRSGASRLPKSLSTGEGIALGITHRSASTVQYFTTGNSLGSVADVEITFRVRPRTARRIIGATSIRGVA